METGKKHDIGKGILGIFTQPKNGKMTFNNTKNFNSVQKLTNTALTIFDENFLHLPVAERNKKIMRDISGCAADLNKIFFMRKFEMNDRFQYRNYLKISTDLVRFRHIRSIF
jgi:hypothetical protein